MFARKQCGALTWIFLLVSTGTSLANLSCMDMNGNPVDWFIIYKLPQDKTSTSAPVRAGSGFMYMDVKSQSFTQPSVSLDTTNQAVAFTLKQVYSNYGSQNVLHGMYNDQPPIKVPGDGGHTKGVVALDSKTGFWLVHSTPKFPDPASSSYKWPDNARKNGQSFLCMTFPYNEFNDIGEQLQYTWPLTYDKNMPSQLTSGVPNLVAGLSGKHVTATPWKRNTYITTTGGQTFFSFAKFTEFNLDLYSDWVALTLKSDLYTETWQNGRGKLPSYCGKPNKVFNVQLVSLPGGVDVKATKDHSKWAVTTNSNVKWSCIGGINRMEGQYRRAGGTVCVDLPNVWKAYNSAVKQYEQCNSNSSMKLHI